MTWKRPELKVRAPNRQIGGFYQAMPGQGGRQAFGGLPLQTPEDAVVAAMLAGYRIADAQIARGMRMAQDLRGSVKDAGIKEPKDIPPAAEALVRRGVLALIKWLTADPSSPLKNVLSAEYLLGALARLEPSARDEIVKQALKLFTGATAPSSTAHAGSAVAPPKIRFEKESRCIELKKWELSSDFAGVAFDPLKFRRTGDPGSTFDGRLERRADDGLTLTVTLSPQTPNGEWKAPICGADNVLIGIVVVEL